MLMVLDSGESLSAQQLTDALGVANRMLENWYNDQAQAMSLLVLEQTKSGQVFIDGQVRTAAPLASAFTFAGGTYNPPTYFQGSYNPGIMPQFPDTISSIAVPAGY